MNDSRKPLEAGQDVRLNWRRVNEVAADLAAVGRQAGLAQAGLAQARRQFDSPAGGGGMRFRGEYDDEAVYAVQDVVVIRSGAHAGAYVCVQSNPGGENPPVLPDVGDYWVSIGRSDTVGSWL